MQLQHSPIRQVVQRDEHADISQERCSQAGNLRANVFDIGFTILNRSEKMKQDKLGRSNFKKNETSGADKSGISTITEQMRR